MKVKTYNQKGDGSGTAELPEAAFGLRWNADLVYQVTTSQEANERKTYAHTKGRSEVRGGGKKPWRQKGTGRARHGSIRSPIWKGGGVTHGPLKEKDYSKKINKKMAKKALFTVLSAKARENELIVLDELKYETAKTKAASEMFAALRGAFKDISASPSRVLVLLPKMDQNVKRSVSNLSFAEVDEARNLTALGALRHKYLVITKEAVATFNEK